MKRLPPARHGLRAGAIRLLLAGALAVAVLAVSPPRAEAAGCAGYNLAL